ncbi:zinc finger, c4 type (two domains) domain-containing protein [Ditylenchus destructor]|uniref:Zinc finger, c4 type (Two domains) domain-containing protein n=1 Tax=Ditylenchus destructor TaxID=166010 RepID=A0AAD4NI86_9BILA|nr:zinc finger, c4 type (two domains) domain-containing protein [Ditylenchus destructor]
MESKSPKEFCETPEPAVPQNISDAKTESYVSVSKCAVCRKTANGYHFGVIVCRACASFFRRAVVEQKNYRCRWNKICSMRKEGSHHICRGCRMRRCLEYIQSFRQNHAKYSQTLFNTTFHQNEQLFLPNCTAKMMILKRGLCAYNTFILNQTSLSTSILDQTKRMPSKSETLSIYRKNIPPMLTLIEELIDIDGLTCVAKADLLEACWDQLIRLHEIYLTTFNYPDIEDKNVALTTHNYTSIDKFIETICEFESDERFHSEDFKRFHTPLIHKMISLINKFKMQKPRQLDFVALMTAIVKNEADRLGILTEKMDATARATFAEWHNDLISLHGLEEGGIRFSNLICLLADLNVSFTLLNSI